MAEIGGGSEISSGETSSHGEVSETSEAPSVEASHVDENDARADALISECGEKTEGNLTDDDISDDMMNELTGNLESKDGLKTLELITDDDISDATMAKLENGLKSADTTDSPSTPQEVSAKQEESLKEGMERLENGDTLTRMEKGNLGEIMMDQHYISHGYESLMSPEDRVSGLDAKGHHGIDGIYEKDGQYVIVEAKYGSGKLIELSDEIRQMSWPWISARLESAVGDEKAVEIERAYNKNPDNVRREVYHYNPKADEDGLTHSDVYSVNAKGEKIGPSAIVDSYRGSERVESYDAHSYGRES